MSWQSVAATSQAASVGSSPKKARQLSPDITTTGQVSLGTGQDGGGGQLVQATHCKGSWTWMGGLHCTALLFLATEPAFECSVTDQKDSLETGCAPMFGHVVRVKEGLQLLICKFQKASEK